MTNNIIEFIRKKDYRFEKHIGQGGTGKTVLLKDELINELFVCKKYEPYYSLHKEKYYRNFVDEIKILHLLYHHNVVRVFNYYLYPEFCTGYILMEYIQGIQINEYIKNNPETINSVFIQTIDGFKHLEENYILHRDIRPENILVSEKGIVKIIDFGFGKSIEFGDNFDKSISLNWRYPKPNEFTSKQYDFRTEVYFVGKLFEEIILSNNIENFNYDSVLNQMIKPNYIERIHSFFDVTREILSNTSNSNSFNEYEKNVYKIFAGRLEQIFDKICDESEYISNLNTIYMDMESIHRDSILEDIIQNPIRIANCFIKGQYYYNKGVKFHFETLESFLEIFRNASSDKKKIILNNIWQRLDNIKRYPKEQINDLPY